MFRIHISQVNPRGGTLSRTFEVDKFGLYVNRYPDKHELAGNVKDVQLALVKDEKIINTYPFIGLWVSLVEKEPGK